MVIRTKFLIVGFIVWTLVGTPLTPVRSLLPAGASAEESNMSNTQEPEPSATDLRIAELEEQKKEADAQTALLKSQNALLAEQKLAKEAELDKLTAGLPTPDSKGLEGTVDTSKASDEFGKILAYSAINEAAGTIAKDVCAKTDGSIYIYDGREFAILVAKENTIRSTLRRMTEGFRQQKKTLENADQIRSAIDDIVNAPADKQASDLQQSDKLSLTQAAEAALQAIPAVLGAVADITKLFRTDSTLAGIAVTTNESALRAAVLNQALTDDECVGRFKDPRHAIVDSDNPFEDDLQDAEDAAAEVAAERDQAFIDIEAARLLALNKAATYEQSASAIFNLAEGRPDKKMTTQELKQFNDFKLLEGEAKARATLLEYSRNRADAAIIASLGALSTLKTELTTAEAGKSSPLQNFAAWSRMKDEDAAFLTMKVETSGAQSVVSKNTFRSDRLAYSGSVVVSYELISKDGVVLAGGLIDATEVSQAKLSKGFAALKDSKPSKNAATSTSTQK